MMDPESYSDGTTNYDPNPWDTDDPDPSAHTYPDDGSHRLTLAHLDDCATCRAHYLALSEENERAAAYRHDPDDDCHRFTCPQSHGDRLWCDAHEAWCEVLPFGEL